RTRWYRWGAGSPRMASRSTDVRESLPMNACLRSRAARFAHAAAAVALCATLASVSGQPSEPRPASPEKVRMTALGIEHKTARNLYDHLKREADGGRALAWSSVPDWTGIWTREASPYFWDPDQASMT